MEQSKEMSYMVEKFYQKKNPEKFDFTEQSRDILQIHPQKCGVHKNPEMCGFTQSKKKCGVYKNTEMCGFTQSQKNVGYTRIQRCLVSHNPEKWVHNNPEMLGFTQLRKMWAT